MRQKRSIAGVCDDLDGPLAWRGATAPRTDVAALRALHAAWSARVRASPPPQA